MQQDSECWSSDEDLRIRAVVRDSGLRVGVAHIPRHENFLWAQGFKGEGGAYIVLSLRLMVYDLGLRGLSPTRDSYTLPNPTLNPRSNPRPRTRSPKF